MDQDQLLERAERRWHTMLADQPELEPAVALQRRLIHRSLELGAVLDSQHPYSVELDERSVIEKLRQGHPVMAGATMFVEGPAVSPYVIGFCADLALGAAGAPAARLQELLTREAIDVGSLVSASLARQQKAIRAKAHHVGVSPDLLWLIAELGAGPVANRVQRALLGSEAEPVSAQTEARRRWNRGFCPACGSWPALAEGTDTRVRLRCSFCGCGWDRELAGCIYCGESGESLLTAALDPEHPACRLELCRSCGGYLKVVAITQPTPFELLPVEDLGTASLDRGAADRGYLRPPMQDLETR